MSTVRERNEAFPPDARIKKRRDFLRIQGRSPRMWGRCFIYCIEEGRSENVRLGITCSRKVGKAVQRNQIKRWVREVFRRHQHLFPRPVSIVLTAKRSVDSFSYATIRDEFVDVFTRYFQQPNIARKPRHRGRLPHRRSAKRGGAAAPRKNV